MWLELERIKLPSICSWGCPASKSVTCDWYLVSTKHYAYSNRVSRVRSPPSPPFSTVPIGISTFSECRRCRLFRARISVKSRAARLQQQPSGRDSNSIVALSPDFGCFDVNEYMAGRLDVRLTGACRCDIRMAKSAPYNGIADRIWGYWVASCRTERSASAAFRSGRERAICRQRGVPGMPSRKLRTAIPFGARARAIAGPAGQSWRMGVWGGKTGNHLCQSDR